MSKAHVPDSIPQNDAEFDIFFRNLINYVKDQTVGANPRWTHIPQAEIDKLDEAYNRWSTAYTQVKGPHTPEHTKKKNDIKKECRKLLRNFINAFLRYHPDVTADDKRRLHIHIHDDERTDIPVPPTRPEFNIKVADIRELHILFRDQDSERRARPYGLNGAVISWDILDAPPAEAEALRNTVLATHTPYTLLFKEQDRGKIVYIALQWQNEKGDRGKHSEIQSAVIP
jgi:hypothetical protein